MGYEVVIPARNEEKYIEKTLLAIKRQSVPPDRIIVINDGSKDRTSEISKKYADVVVDLPDRGFSALGTPEITKVFNKGLEQVSPEAEYILICGADAVIPEKFFETIRDEMEKKPELVIASGKLENDPSYEGAPPRGTRVVKSAFWMNASSLRYPETLGWESWLVFKALQMGKSVKRLSDLVTEAQRPPSTTRARYAWGTGKGMRLLGYDWKYALARAGKIFMEKPNAGIKMIAGYISTTNGEKTDVAEWVGKNQRKRFWRRVYIQIQDLIEKRDK
jgi:glycosyltransferase involved in cell wall biosynthesis